MTDAPARGRHSSTLGLRLALVFLGVALAAVALNAVLTAVFSAVDVSSLATRQRNELAGTLAVTAAGAWEQHDSWSGADLAAARALAAHTGMEFQVRDAAGRTVAASSGFTPPAGPTTSVPIVDSQGTQIGTVVVALTASGIGGADAVLRTALLRAIAGTAGLAALLALVSGLGVSRRITRPVARLVSVTRAMGSGDRSSRVGEIKAPGELRELAAAFDNMADTLDHEDKLRRDLVASVAHELRTPVAVLQAGHEALLDGITEPTPEELGSLRDEVLRLARMVDDLQTMAAADAAVLQLARERRDLAGIAGTAPKSGTLGFAAWARWVVDWDLGRHLLPSTAPEVPHGYLPGRDVGTNVFRLNDALVRQAYRLTRNLTLTDSPQAAEERAHYPGQAGLHPYVAVCDTITGDDYWVGRELSETAEYITALRTGGQGRYCTAQQEDNATATALARHGYLDRYLVLRTAANFDQPWPGQTVTQHLALPSPARGPAVDNAYLVASTVAHHVVASSALH